MSVSEWKKVNLYGVTLCPQYKNSLPKGDLTCVCYNAKQKVVCDAAGYVYVYFHNWECISFRAVETAITLCSITNNTNLLFIVTKNAEKEEWLLKGYSLSKINKRTGAPCVGNAHLISNCTPTALAVYMRGTSIYLAIGYQKGQIFLHRGTLSNDMSGNFQSIIATSWSITGIEFQYLPQQMYMFVCSYGGIILYTLNESAIGSFIESKIVLDSAVAPARCCTLWNNSNDSYFIIGRDDALYCFTRDGRGPCYALDGIKKHIRGLGQNIIVILEQGNNDNIIVIDTRHKMITLNKQMNKIFNVIVEKDECFIITQDGDIYQMREWDLENKLRILCEKNLYNVALQLIEGSEKPDEQLSKAMANIYLKYGDSLLVKGDVNEAIEKYIRTLGYVEPYCIIQKLMDSRYTKYLAQYLHALVSSKYVEPEHLQLLQNCNERLQLPQRLTQTYENLNYNNIDEKPLANDCNTLENCLSLNKFLNESHDLNLLENMFAKSTEEEIYNFFLEHGQILMEKYAAITVAVLKKLCAKVQQPERFLNVLIYNEYYCHDFVKYVIEEHADCHKSLLDVMLDLSLRAWQQNQIDENSNALMKFLEDYKQKFNCQHAFILCRLYRFWPGLKYLYKYCLQNNYLENSDEEKDSTNTLLKTLIKKDSFTANQNSNLFANLLNELLDEKDQSTLQILKNLCTNKDIKMTHVKQCFGQQHFKKDSYDLREQKQLVEHLLQMTETLKELVDHYETRPIEFRCSNCDVCKQELKPPSKYFLCQHSFHTECLSAYEESSMCVVCMGNKRTQFLPENLDKSCANEKYLYKDLLFHGIFNKAKNELEFQKPVLKTKHIKPAKIPDDQKQWMGRFENNRTELNSKNPFEENTVSKSTNPFEEYDSNLNPFEE